MTVIKHAEEMRQQTIATLLGEGRPLKRCLARSATRRDTPFPKSARPPAIVPHKASLFVPEPESQPPSPREEAALNVSDSVDVAPQTIPDEIGEVPQPNLESVMMEGKGDPASVEMPVAPGYPAVGPDPIKPSGPPIMAAQGVALSHSEPDSESAPPQEDLASSVGDRVEVVPRLNPEETIEAPRRDLEPVSTEVEGESHSQVPVAESGSRAAPTVAAPVEVSPHLDPDAASEVPEGDLEPVSTEVPGDSPSPVPEAESGPSAIATRTVTGVPAIELRNVSLSFESKRVLTSVSFVLGAGETLILLGVTGSGKSVLLKLMLGLLKPDERPGVDRGAGLGSPFRGQPSAPSQRMGIVFQEGALFDSLSVFDNVAYRLREEHVERRSCHRTARARGSALRGNGAGHRENALGTFRGNAASRGDCAHHCQQPLHHALRLPYRRARSRHQPHH